MFGGNLWERSGDEDEEEEGGVYETTVPTHSIPNTRGSCTPGEWPWRVKSSERLRPKAWTFNKMWFSGGGWIGRVWTVRTEGGPGFVITTARIVFGIGDILNNGVGVLRCGMVR